MLDEYIVREQVRASVHWEASCASASDDALRRQIDARLSEGHLPAIHGVSRSHRGTGRPCLVCRSAIEATEVEREVDSVGVVLHAHEACYKLWREQSRDGAALRRRRLSEDRRAVTLAEGSRTV